jgi:hypothetical protein
MRILSLTIALLGAALVSAQEPYLLDRLPEAQEKPAYWPASVRYPQGMLPFVRAKNTQSIFKLSTNGGPSLSTIDRVPRSKLLAKWQVSGGMEGIDTRLWKSDVYQRIDGGYRWQAMISVKNSLGYFQNEIGHKVSYGDGTLFMDVLSNRQTGKVFEHRVAEKQNGQWRRYVAFRDESQRPAGYVGLRNVTCTTCHNTTDGPGTGGYGVGLVPGGDTVVSYPFPGLEP